MENPKANQDPTKRFSSRVDNYIKYRPDYPRDIIPFLQKECGLTTSQVVADVGSGTGKLTELFLKHGNRVIGIEPNREMREAAERLLAAHPNFESIDATAEATTLENARVDMITAGQAFHWFDREKARAEFARILKPRGWVVLTWNDRKTNGPPFLQAYEKIMETYGNDYRANNHKNVDAAAMRQFFGEDKFKRATFPNAQVFDFEGLKGRVLSSSYAPEAGHPNHLPMLNALEATFDLHQSNGTVALECDTALYYGQLSG